MAAHAFPDRLHDVASYAIAEAAREPELDAISAEAARATGAPVALVGILGSDREWVKGAVGWNATVLPLAASFAARMERERDVVLIGDAEHDQRMASHPLVTGTPFIRFFAGAPIIDTAGHFLGALSVVDRVPRILTGDQQQMLRVLARHATRELEMRRDRLGREQRAADLAASLADSDERFREFFEQTNDLVMSIGADGRVLHANQTVLSVLGCSHEELTRTPLLRVIDPEEREHFRTVFADAMTSGEPQRIETVFITGGARRITVEGSLQPKRIDGVPVLARVIFRDVSDRKQFEAELGNARDAALEAARLKTQFLANVSHEIRTPMNGIVGMIDLLLATPLAAEQQDFAHQARTGAEQLLAIVNNILYVSNLESGGLATENVDFDLFRTLQRVVEVMKIAALGKDLDVSLVYDEKLPPIFRGHQARLRQVVSNLMENAVKFTEEGSVVLSVATQTETETHRVVRFEVRDTGIGIAEEDRLLLFEKFSQVEATSTRRFGGVGLGLATARQLVEMMGGLMDVESKPGVGSTFWFTIPFPKAGQQGRRPIVSSDLDFKGKRVLLVDHYPTSRRIVQHYLETTWGMRVEVADSPERAREGEPYRVVVSDDLPAFDMRGASLVYLASPNAEINQEKLRAAGVHACVMKPVGQGELFDALTIALAHDGIATARPAAQPFDSRPAPPVVSAELRKSIRVLLAEDNFLNRKLTMSQLEKLGYSADSVANGKEALEALDRNVYAIVLMDCQMPILDGYEATIEIRKREAAAGIRRRRIIAMTANALEGDREKCLAAGMDDYLAKPTKHEELEVALARFFG